MSKGIFSRSEIKQAFQDNNIELISLEEISCARIRIEVNCLNDAKIAMNILADITPITITVIISIKDATNQAPLKIN